MNATLPIVAIAALLTVAGAEPVLSQATAPTEAEVCVGTETKSSWASGNASSRLPKPDAEIAARRDQCGALQAANAPQEVTIPDRRGSSGYNSGTTGTENLDIKEAEASVEVTATAGQPAYPGQ